MSRRPLALAALLSIMPAIAGGQECHEASSAPGRLHLGASAHRSDLPWLDATADLATLRAGIEVPAPGIPGLLSADARGGQGEWHSGNAASAVSVWSASVGYTLPLLESKVARLCLRAEAGTSRSGFEYFARRSAHMPVGMIVAARVLRRRSLTLDLQGAAIATAQDLAIDGGIGDDGRAGLLIAEGEYRHAHRSRSLLWTPRATATMTHASGWSVGLGYRLHQPGLGSGGLWSAKVTRRF